MQDLLFTAIKAAVKAGHEILAIYSNRHFHLKVEYKADLSPKTNADVNSQRAIIETLEPTGMPVLSEESEPIDYEVRKSWEQFWIIDPLDGTKEFLRRNGEFTVNIALISECRPVLGVIYAPVTGELYWGCESLGAWKTVCRDLPGDLEVLTREGSALPQKRKSKTIRVVGSRSNKTPEVYRFLQQIDTNGRKVEFISMGSSLKICRVAEGQADFYPRFGPTMEWDTAAGHAIAVAAGKNLTETDLTTPLTYNKQVLVNPHFILR